MSCTRNFVSAYYRVKASVRGKSIMGLYTHKCSTYGQLLVQFTIWVISTVISRQERRKSAILQWLGLLPARFLPRMTLRGYAQCSCTLGSVSNRTHIECIVPRCGRTCQLFLSSTMLPFMYDTLLPLCFTSLDFTTPTSGFAFYFTVGWEYRVTIIHPGDW